ncbi:MAG TPA: ABC transporter ATP-binding protein [Candidatus Acidoferrum sp.]|jgi:lipopolysaccharide transport system ATP-binding protein|nr:ABC transporter ATP-binding protein [Candidatus Acidoferrum sp.]
MSNIAIHCEGLGKQYRLGAASQHRYKALRDVLAGAATAPFRAAAALARGERVRKEKPAPFWALRDVSFDIEHGEIVGVIGRNGAGKSTLLKILSKITTPTTGYARIHGRVGSLLEVGSGFHPELTGRDNIYMNGAILGMTRREIERKFDEIVAFAEVEKFVDTPVKRYSSGMYLRLAFAVAAHLEPEILFVDEVLAVGDAAFQKKCLGKMNEVSRQGRTIIFVSHNMTALRNLCTRAIWLADGKVVEDGEAGAVVADYLQRNSSSRLETVWDDPGTAPGNDRVRLHSVRVIPKSVDEAGQITVSSPIQLEFCYWNLVPDAVLHISIFLYSLEEVCIFNVGSEAAPRPRGLIRHTCEIPGNLLNDGCYYLRLLIVRDLSTPIFTHNNVAAFEVRDLPRAGAWYGKWQGAVRPNLKWATEVIGAESSLVRS